MTQLPLPCPFCGWEKIRIIEYVKRDGLLKGHKYTFAWCRVCGTRGPSAYTLDEPDSVVYEKAIERWNERGGKKHGTE